MKKQRKQFVLLLILLLLLVAGYFGVQKYNEAQANQPDELVDMVINVKEEDVTEISYVYEGEELTFVKDENIWKYKDDTGLNIVQSNISAMVTAVARLESQGKIENITDLSEYGLDEPTMEISFVAAGETYHVSVGDFNELSVVYYITLDDSDMVYAVEGALIDAFSYTLEDLIEEVEEAGTSEGTVSDSESASEHID